MDQEMELEPEPEAIEIRSALWQKIFVAPLILLFCGMGVIGAIGGLYPQLLESRPHKLPDVWTRAFMGLIGGPLMFGLGLQLCPPWFYRLRADELGLTESLGWKETRVFWSDVDSFTMEPNSNQHGEARRHVEPVLCDAAGAILFRPASTVVACDEATLEKRRAFWEFMQARLAGKQKPWEPPPPVPSIYDGKSTAWKIKRVALIGFCTLAFVGLWSWAVLWAAPQPDLPRWILGVIVSAILWMPLLCLLAAQAIAKIRKLRRASRDAPQVLEAPDLGIT